MSFRFVFFCVFACYSVPSCSAVFKHANAKMANKPFLAGVQTGQCVVFDVLSSMTTRAFNSPIGVVGGEGMMVAMALSSTSEFAAFSSSLGSVHVWALGGLAGRGTSDGDGEEATAEDFERVSSSMKGDNEGSELSRRTAGLQITLPTESLLRGNKTEGDRVGGASTAANERAEAQKGAGGLRAHAKAFVPKKLQTADAPREGGQLMQNSRAQLSSSTDDKLTSPSLSARAPEFKPKAVKSVVPLREEATADENADEVDDDNDADFVSYPPDHAEEEAAGPRVNEFSAPLSPLPPTVSQNAKINGKRLRLERRTALSQVLSSGFP